MLVTVSLALEMKLSLYHYMHTSAQGGFLFICVLCLLPLGRQNYCMLYAWVFGRLGFVAHLLQ